MNTTYETIVVGAGVSGLALAHFRGRDADLLVLDSAKRPGGLVQTIRVEEPYALRYEWGPEALATTSEVTNALLDEIGLERHDVSETGKRRFLVQDRRLVDAPMSPPALFKTPLLSLGGKLRFLTEKWRDPRRALDGSIAEFVRHRLGPQALDGLVDPLISGIHAGDPELLSMRACFPQVVRWIEEHGSVFAAMKARSRAGAAKPGLCKPVGGMGTLVERLASGLGSRLSLDTEVQAIERSSTGWTLTLDGARVQAERLVLALPLRAAARLLADVAPEAARPLESMQSEHVVSVSHLYERERVGHALDGFGYLVPSREGLAHLGTLFSSTLDPGAAPEGYVLLRTLLGGARRPEQLERDDEELTELAAREVGALLSITGPPAWSYVERYPAVMPRYDLQHPRRVADVRRALPPGLELLGNYLEGLGVPALIESAAQLAARDDQPSGPVQADALARS